MKINIDQILSHELINKHYLSNDILRFELVLNDLYSEKSTQYKNISETSVAFLEKEILKYDYQHLGSRDELMEINLQHIFNAAYYYTNGQKIVTLFIRNDHFEIGVHKDFRNFVDYFNRVPMFSQFSLSNLKLNSYRLLEKAELEILRVLSELTVQRIPVIRGEDIEHMEILKTYPYKHTFSYGDKTLYIHENEAYHMHSASTEVINWMKPLVLKCCRNCVFFQYSGMSLDMSGGNAGYCKLPLNQTAESIVTNIWNWCDKFERNVKI